MGVFLLFRLVLTGASAFRGPQFVVPLNQVMIARSPLWRVAGAGAIAAGLILVIPLLLNSLLAVAGRILFRETAFVRVTMIHALAEVWTALPYVVLACLIGGGLGALRWVSVSRQRFWSLFGMEVGLNTVVVLVASYAAVVVLFVSQVGPMVIPLATAAAVPFLLAGFIVDGLWEGVHGLVLAGLCKAKRGALMAMEVKEYLGRFPEVGEIALDTVDVQDGAVILHGQRLNRTRRHAVEEALMKVDGVESIRFAFDDPEPTA